MMKKYYLLIFFSFSALRLLSQVPLEGLVAYYPFNGNTHDESGNGSDGIIHGALLANDRHGNPNSAYYFDGLDDYVVADASALPTAERTISVWFFTNNVENRPGLIGYGGNVMGTSWFMGLNLSGKQSFHMNCHGNICYIDYFYETPPVNKWYHWVITTSSSGTKLFINGILKAANSTFVTNTFATGTQLGIGTISSTYGIVPFTDINVKYFGGLLDDIRIYNRALTTQEIIELYHENNWDIISLPQVNTVPALNITGTSAVLGGNVIHDGGSWVSERGICFDTTQSPTTEDIKLIMGNGTGEFSGSVTSLTISTTYYVRAYAINSVGTAYGNEISFTTSSTINQTGNFTDSRDGKIYKKIKIGNQWWMAENLAWLPVVSPPTNGSDSYPYYYVYGYSGDDVTTAKTTANYITYGVLYNWFASLTACPQGWHLPSEAEFTVLSNYLINNGYGFGGSGDDIAKSMAAKTNWINSSYVGTPGNDTGNNNSSGFAGLPGGHRSINTNLYGMGQEGRWWSSTEFSGITAWPRYLDYDNAYFSKGDYYKGSGFSVRCVKDNVNNPPSANAGPDQTIDAGALVTLDGSASSDPDGDEITYLWTFPPGFTLNSDTIVNPTFTAPDVDVTTNYTFSLKVNDGQLDSPADEIMITVLSPNNLQTDSLALIELYNSTNGPNWKNNTNWLTGPVSTWHGITVSIGRVTKMDLGNNYLSGELPASVGDMKMLEEIYLYYNNLSGKIPLHLGKLKSLYLLNLYTNHFSGTIPPELSQLTSLKWINLKNNQLTGSIPPEIGQLANLEDLDLSGNKLSGALPVELGELTNLRGLYLYNNQFTGSIPPELCQLSELINVYLFGNQLTGSIPHEIGNLLNLLELKLSDNQLSGNLPQELAILTHLYTIEIKNNGLHGSVLKQIPDLRNLYCSNNKFLFSELPVQLPVSGGTYQFSPQKLVFDTLTISKGEVIDFSPEANIDGALTQFTWYKDNIKVVENDSTGRFTPQSHGVYYCIMTNKKFPGLNLQSNNITVINNSIPVSHAGNNQTVLEGKLVTLDGSCSFDPENQPLTFLWTPPSGIILSDNKAVKPTFITPQVNGDTSFIFTLVVNDGISNSVPDQVVINVSNFNTGKHFIPIWSGNGIDQMNINVVTAMTGEANLEAGDEVAAFDGNLCVGVVKLTQSISVSNFNTYGFIKASKAEVGFQNGYTPGHPITFRIWVQSEQKEYSANQVTFLNPQDGQPVSPVPYIIGGTAYVKVLWVNSKPIANAGPDQSVDEGMMVYLDGLASHDPDGELLTYSWTAPTCITLSSNTVATPNFTAPAVLRDTTLLLTLVVSDGILNSEPDIANVTIRLVPKHFKTIWTGNGTDHMLVNINGATLDGTDLETDDEIGLFDGDLCTGAGILQEPLSPQSILLIKASADDGTGNGYTDGHSLRFVVYKKSEDKEYTTVTATYDSTNPSWSTDGKFHIGGTAFAELSALSIVTLTLNLEAGWNIFSVNNLPVNPDMLAIFQPLIDNGCLIKVQDESGNSLEDLGFFGGWTNNIGDISVNEGYKVKLNSNCQLTVEGTPVTFPIQIPLTAGWNIISFPGISEADGMTVVQQLIDRGTLIKVQDESGNSLEDFGFFGGWQNTIGNFKPGEGYKVKVSANETLTIFDSYTKSSVSPVSQPSPVHFKTLAIGNGVDHMNLNLVGIPAGLLEVGDEVGVFDGSLCVGAIVIGIRYSVIGQSQSEIRNPQSEIRNLSIPVTASDELGMPGFKEGNPYLIKIWQSSANREYTAEPVILKGSSTFVKHESTLVSLENLKIREFEDLKMEGTTGIRIFPNPTTGKVYIEPVNRSLIGMRLQVLDATGRVLINRLADQYREVIDLSQNPRGIYYLKLSGESMLKVVKVILE